MVGCHRSVRFIVQDAPQKTQVEEVSGRKHVHFNWTPKDRENSISSLYLYLGDFRVQRAFRSGETVVKEVCAGHE